jgi:hypothetical protein
MVRHRIDGASVKVASADLPLRACERRNVLCRSAKKLHRLATIEDGARDIPPRSAIHRADQTQRNGIGRSAKMVDLLKTINRCGNAFHSSLQLEGQKLRVVT